VQSLFKEFDINGDGKLTLNQAYKGFCKIAEIVPMD
jgi:Ca2+-binding EF-hand superfamily protein